MSDARPLVSIGIPGYNRPAGLIQALRCICSQSYRNIEIIVSDNCTPGSEIDTIMQAAMESDRRIQYFKQEKNIGATANFQFVLSKAKGKYFAWAADDDLCEDTFVEKIIAILENNADVALCGCDIEIIDENGTYQDSVELDSIRLTTDWHSGKKLFFCYPISNIFFCIYGIFRTEYISKCNVGNRGAWKGFATNSEVPILGEVSRYGKIIAIPERLKSYRRHTQSVYNQETKTISVFDAFMLRFIIRARLLRLAMLSGSSFGERLSLMGAVVMSAIESFRLPSAVLNILPKSLRNSIRHHASKLPNLWR